MSNSIKDQLESLVELQTTELEANSIESLLDRLPERIEALDAELKAFEQDIEKDIALADELDKKYRDQEGEVQMNLSRIEKSQAKLRELLS